MTYETPWILESCEAYEAPLLLDLEDLPACERDCSTGGSASLQ